MGNFGMAELKQFANNLPSAQLLKNHSILMHIRGSRFSQIKKKHMY